MRGCKNPLACSREGVLACTHAPFQLVSAYECRASRRAEHGFLISRGLGELRRARLHPDLVQSRGGPFLRTVLQRGDAQGAVLEATDVLVAGVIGVGGAVVMLHVPAAFRSEKVYRELLEAAGVRYDPSRALTWLVPPPWWAQNALAPVYDPFRLMLRGE